MRAIETSYKGYRFRSRLEARWAVFFDVLGIEWEYEKEGYQLCSGCYLPDFWLGALDCWVEIKPGIPTREEMMLCEQLGHHTDRGVVMVSGTPGAESLRVYCSDSTDGSGGTDWWEDPTGWCPQGPHWSIDIDGSTPCICSGNDWPSRAFMSPDWGVFPGMAVRRDCLHSVRPRAEKAILDRAYTAARSARFEHGESGAPR